MLCFGSLFLLGAICMIVSNLFENCPDETELTLFGVSDGTRHSKCVVLNEEHTLKLYREDMLLHTFVCSPSNLSELCVGWLWTEGCAADRLEISQDGGTAVIYGVTHVLTEAEICCRPREIPASTGEILELFQAASDKYARSHGIHECVIKGAGWHILRTDIGRHNAIDKAVGAAVLAGYDLGGAVMFSSGRINMQTVKKAARCKIGCLMSKAVITHDALVLARELGLNVLFSVKENSYLSV